MPDRTRTVMTFLAIVSCIALGMLCLVLATGGFR